MKAATIDLVLQAPAIGAADVAEIAEMSGGQGVQVLVAAAHQAFRIAGVERRAGVAELCAAKRIDCAFVRTAGFDVLALGGRRWTDQENAAGSDGDEYRWAMRRANGRIASNVVHEKFAAARCRVGWIRQNCWVSGFYRRSSGCPGRHVFDISYSSPANSSPAMPRLVKSGISAVAIRLMTAQARIYPAIGHPDPVDASRAVAISGAGPPAMSEAN